MIWEVKTLEDLFEKGSSKLTLKAVREGIGPFKVFGAKGLCGHSYNYDQENPYFAVIKDGAGVGRISRHEPKTSVLGTMQYLVPRGQENFNFLHYALLNLKLRSFAVGSTIPHIYFKDYKGSKVGVPPLEEQERIVEVLDEAFASIDKAKANIERNLTNARELFQSRLNDIFSNPSKDWEEKTLGEVCKVEMGQSPPSTTYNSDGKGEPLINGPVEFGPKPFSDTVMTKWTTAPKKFCIKGDVILCVRGSTTGRMNIAGFDAAIGRGCAAIRYDRNPMWLAFFIRFMGEQILNSGTGSTFPNFSSAQLRALSFPMPSDNEMNEVVGELKTMDECVARILSHYQTELDNLEELRQSILEQAFEGELTKTVAA